ncbi:MAG: hypothetical protein HGA78_02820, partial [Nitrospirales bacterium]|nr:hypothetical protein [Nitrospirales bacterium]
SARVIRETPDGTVIHIDPKGQRKLEISLTQDLPKGNYDAVVSLQTPDGSQVLQEFDLTIRTPYLPWINRCPKAAVFLLVFLGALTSIFLTTFPSISSTKRSNRERITDLRESIRRLTAFDKDLNNKFTVKLVEAEALNRNTKVYTPSASERLKNIETILQKLEEQLKVRQEISDRYVEIDSADTLPFSIEHQIRRTLREADQALYMDRPDLAREKQSEAKESLKFDHSAFVKHSSVIMKKAKALLKTLSDDPRRNDMLMLYNALTESVHNLAMIQPTQASASEFKKREFEDKVRSLDMTFSKAEIYYVNLIKRAHEDIGKKDLMKAQECLSCSETYHDIEDALFVVESLREGVTEKLIHEALSRKEFSVVRHPSDPSVNSLVTFDLTFSNEKINKSPLIQTYRFRYVWAFGDGTSNAEGRMVIHYYKRRGLLVIFRNWLMRTLCILKLRGTDWKSFPLSVEVLGTDGTILATGNRNPVVPPVSVKEPLDREYSSGITLNSALGFFVTLFISSAISMTTTYEETYSFQTLKDIIAPFLLGFGLDIGRDKLQEAAKKYTQKKPGAS